VIQNGYATLAEFKHYAIPAGAPDQQDDAVIEAILDAASRYIDDKTGRRFYPRVETRYYSVVDSPQLWLDDDLLAVVTLTNGEGTAIASTEYNLLPRNEYPKYAVQLKSTSDVYWQADDDSESEYVIPLVGIWGYHDSYTTRAWRQITTINAVGGITAAQLTITLTAAAVLDVDGSQLIKIGDEMMHTNYVTGNILTVLARGGNGSTAAIHADTSPVYLWTYQPDIVNATLEIASSIYKRRTGENATSTSVLTSGGVIITPRDVPDLAASVIRTYRRIL